MTIDLLGPASDQATLARPGRTISRGALDTWFKDCTSPDAEDGTAYTADFFNDLLAQIRTALRSAGITLDGADDMLWRAMQSIGLRFGTDTGAANNIAVAFSPAVAALTDGMPLLIRVANPNTGATNITSNATASKPLVWPGGGAMSGGELSASSIILVVYDATGTGSYQLISRSVASAGLLGVKRYTASGTYTKDPRAKYVRMFARGAGGAGGAGWANSPQGTGGGGGGGGYVAKLFTASTLSATESFTIGAGGVGNTNNATPGGDGGDTIFKTCVAHGGKGGSPYYATPNSACRGGIGGLASGGDNNIQGGNGCLGNAVGVAAHGGATWGGMPSFNYMEDVGATVPTNAAGPGSGGPGGWQIGMPGANGADGEIIFEEYGA